MSTTELETFRCRIYGAPPVVEIQCAHCLTIASDTEPGMSREAVTALRERMKARGWVVAEPDGDDPLEWQEARDFCSAECAAEGLVAS